MTFGFVCAVADFNSFRKYVQYAAVFASAGLLLQIALYFVLGFYPPLVIPYLPMATGESARELFIQYLSEDRPACFFLEPSNYSYYAVLDLSLALLDSDGLKKNLKIVFFLTFSLIISRSGSAYVLMALVYFIYLFYSYQNLSNKIKSRIVVLMFCLPLLYPLLSATEEVQKLFMRTQEFKLDDVESNSHASGYLRMYRGFMIFQEMNIEEKIIGIGHSNVEMFKKNHSNIMLDMGSDDEEGLYLNGLSQILIYNGFIGILLCIISLYPYLKNKNSRIYVILFFGGAFISSNYNTDMKLLIYSCIIWYGAHKIMLKKIEKNEVAYC